MTRAARSCARSRRTPSATSASSRRPGKGKGDAVRIGFAAAKHDVLMILDGDLSVRPEDLPKFHRGLVDGRAELVNGSRLVYDMEPGAMRFLNMLGNRIVRAAAQVDHRPAGEGHALRDEGAAPERLRPDRRRRARTSASSTRSATSTCSSAPRGSTCGSSTSRSATSRARYGETNISRWRHGVLLLR